MKLQTWSFRSSRTMFWKLPLMGAAPVSQTGVGTTVSTGLSAPSPIPARIPSPTHFLLVALSLTLLQPHHTPSLEHMKHGPRQGFFALIWCFYCPERSHMARSFTLLRSLLKGHLFKEAPLSLHHLKQRLSPATALLYPFPSVLFLS